jgi:hypothetical protein
MNGQARLVGATLVFAAMIGGAQARSIPFEIDGQRYVYDTSDREQAEKVRQLMKAAKAAEAAKAKADAEIAGTPLAKLFGSSAQKDAEAAQARLQQIIGEAREAASPASEADRKSRRARRPVRDGARTRTRPAAVEARATPEDARAAEPAAFAVDARSERAPPAGAGLQPDPATQDATASIDGAAPGARQPALKSVTFDLSSGIKTVQLADGTVREEPLDSGTVAKLSAMEPAAESLTTFVARVRAIGPGAAGISTGKGSAGD